MLDRGHKLVDAEKLNDILKVILPNDRLSSFERNFVAYKLAENEEEFIKDYKYYILNGE